MERGEQGDREGQAGGCRGKKKGSKGMDVGFALRDNLAYHLPLIPFEMHAGKGREGLAVAGETERLSLAFSIFLFLSQI